MARTDQSGVASNTIFGVLGGLASRILAGPDRATLFKLFCAGAAESLILQGI